MIKKAALFDLDNTLYDYDIVNKKAMLEVYKVLRLHIKISKEKFNRLFKISKREIHRELAGTASAHNRTLYFQRLIEKTNQTVEPKIILKLYNTYWNYVLKNMKLRKGVLGVLKKLKLRGMQIAVISNLTTNIQLRKLYALKISKYVDVLVTSEEAGSEKPHAIMFLLALNKLDLTPKEVIMVGDNTVSDIEGANSAKIDTVLLKRGKLAREANEDYEKANYVIKTIPEVLNILDNIEHQQKRKQNARKKT